MSDETTHDSGPSMPFIPGVIVDGKYRLERPIARGGMGFVVLGRHVQLDQPVALKFMHAWLAHTVPKGAARFLDEARAAARLQSDHVARVSDTGVFQGSPYMVMEFLEGEDLETLLRRQPVLPVALAVRYALQAGEALGKPTPADPCAIQPGGWGTSRLQYRRSRHARPPTWLCLRHYGGPQWDKRQCGRRAHPSG